MSASQIDHATMTVDQLSKMLFKMKCSQETEALRARLPAQLAPFASNISIIKPIQTVFTSPNDGVHCCACKVQERKICMSVAVVPHSQSPDSEEPHAKPLKLVWRDWWTSSKYLSGSADSHTHSISLQYGPPRRGMRSNARAYTGWYDDPGMSSDDYSHGDLKSVAGEVARDMGLQESELDSDKKLEVIEALLGDDGRQLLESHAQDETTLRKVIEDELEAAYF